MMRWISAVCFMLYMHDVLAILHPHVDLYGDTSQVAHGILERFSTSVYQLAVEEHRVKQQYHQVPAFLSKKMYKKKMVLCEAIKRAGHYIYTDYQSIRYYNKAIYVTIEVIRSEDTDRMRWVDTTASGFTINSKIVRKNDVIQHMQDYLAIGDQLALHDQLDPFHLDCHSYHCLYGFKHPALKPYRQRFDAAILKQRSLILKTLKTDPDSEKRIASAYLIGEFQDPREIINLLTPYFMDRNPGVRNSVMRVIGGTMYSAHITDLNLKPYIDILDSPYETDRNKALFILLMASENPKQKQYIHDMAYHKLVLLSKLKQPNLRDIAVKILELLHHGKDKYTVS